MELTLIKSIESDASSVLIDVCFDYLAVVEKCDILLFEVEFLMNESSQKVGYVDLIFLV